MKELWTSLELKLVENFQKKWVRILINLFLGVSTSKENKLEASVDQGGKVSSFGSLNSAFNSFKKGKPLCTL